MKHLATLLAGAENLPSQSSQFPNITKTSLSLLLQGYSYRHRCASPAGVTQCRGGDTLKIKSL